MRAARLTSLLFALAAAASAQSATVQNAALYQGTTYPIFSSLTGILGVVAAPASQVSFLGTSPNVISPRMLAVLSYPVPLADPFNSPTPQPVNATLYIRPVGSSTLIPVSNITSAVTGNVTFVVPGYVPLGGAELLYQIDNSPTQWTNLNVVQSSFAFFRSGIGGPAMAQAIPASGPGFSAGLATPIQPGQTLSLTGSGLGYGTTVTATIGGVSAPVIYAGPNGTMAGHDQILLQVPPGVTPGCYVPVAVTTNQTTLTTTISQTSEGSPCKHPWQLSLSDMKMLDSGGFLADASIQLGTQLTVVTAAAGSRSESANMNVSGITASQLAGYFQPASVALGCVVAIPVSVTPAFGFFLGVPGAGSNPPTQDIGRLATLQTPTTLIQLTGTDGYYSSQNLPPPVDGPLSNLPVPAIAGGKWTFQSSGGADLGPSSFEFTLPAPVQLAGGVPVMMNHTQDQTVAWNGAAFDGGATAFVSLSGNGFVSCTSPANAGTLTIPAALLSGFGANTIGTLTISISEAGAGLPHTQFQTKQGKTLLLFVPFSSSDSRPVFFQ